MQRITFTLAPVPPFRLDLIAWALRRRPDNRIDRWDGETYERTLVVEGIPVEVGVIQTGQMEQPAIQVTVSAERLMDGVEQVVTGALERLLGLQIDLGDFYRFARQDQTLWQLVAPFRGFKPPRYPTIFETLVNAISCQQVTLTLGIRMLNRLAETYGSAISGGEPAFPRPEDLVSVEPADLRTLSYSGQKARAVLELSSAVVDGKLDLASVASMDDATALAWLRQLHGVGRWTAEYVLLRGVGRLHVFPGDDVGARNNLQRWLAITTPLDYDGVHRSIAAWQPYGGLLYLHLLLDALTRAGYITR